METSQQQPQESVQASVTAAEVELAQFVKDNRQKLPALPAAPSYAHLSVATETDAEAAERERRESERATAKLKADIYQRAVDLIYSAGQRYRDCTLENFSAPHPLQRKVVNALRAYIANDSQENVILFGPVGTGKDHLAFSLCKSAIKGGRTAKWINGQTWFGIVRDAMDTDKPEASLISEFSRPDLLCLSDPLPPVGALTQHQATMLYRLVDARYSRGVPTICTINVKDNNEADDRMGAATWDRLCHGAWKMFCNWPTFRQPAMEI